MPTQSNSGIPLGQWSGSDATNALRDTIVRLNTAADIQTREMIRMTRWIMWLTIVMAVGVAVQIALAMLALV
jgi:hypothetical protein